MKANFLALGLFGLASASAVLPREDYKAAKPAKPATNSYAVNSDGADKHDYEDGYEYKDQAGGESTWKPKSKSPEFFNLRIDDACAAGEDPLDCPFNGYAIRLEGGIFIATPYNKWWDPKLPTFFADDDTQLYTVRCHVNLTNLD
jgi:hypothetical protein